LLLRCNKKVLARYCKFSLFRYLFATYLNFCNSHIFTPRALRF